MFKATVTRMNYSTLLGILLSLLLLAFIILYAAQDPYSFINLPGLAIVIGGTLAALFLSFPLREIKHGVKSIKLFLFY